MQMSKQINTVNFESAENFNDLKKLLADYSRIMNAVYAAIYNDIHYDKVLNNLKSGATQAAAGAAKNEMWVTSGHATLPDGVLMTGL